VFKVCFVCLRYVLTLVVDGMRSVRSFNFDKSAASVLTSCVSFLNLSRKNTQLMILRIKVNRVWF
jgi:hypothetical protein